MNTITKKLTSVMTALLVGATIFGFVALPAANALSTDQVNAIVGLLSSFGASSAVIADVTAALNGQPTSGGNSGSGSGSSCSTYGTSSIVRVGMNGENVKAIQRAMNQILSLSGGSMAPLAVDGAFGPLTKGVVQYFQGIISTPADGVWGPNTQASYLTYVANHCNGGTPVPPVTGSAMVSVSSDTPAGAKIATNGNANVLKFKVTAGSANLSIDDMTFTRYGQSTNSAWENIKVLDGNMVALTSAGSLNSNNQVKLTFTPDVSIDAGTSKEFYLRVGVDSAATAGQSASFGIASINDIDFVGTPVVSGSFPITGNSFEVLSLTIGGVSVTNDGSVSDSTPDTGDQNVDLNKFKVSVNSVEPVVIEQIQVEKQGSASSDDTVNIELYDVTNNVSLGTVASWDAQGLATFKNLNISVAEGATRRFKVRADIVDGAGLTLNADFTDGSDVRMQVKGSDFGYYITPSVTGGWNGKGSSDQTIASGGLTVVKSSSTPATGNITKGTDRLLGVFDMISTGEPVQISSFKVGFNLGTMTDSEISNARLKNFTTGELLGGPNTISTTDYDPNSSSSYEATATFTDVFEIPVGTTKVGVYVDISNDVSANDTIKVGIPDADADITAKGLTSNDSITASPSAAEVNGNTLTVKAGSLTATTLTTPAARSVVVGAQDFMWAEFNLAAANSGENVEVTDITIANAIAGTAAQADLDNVELWANLTGGSTNDSARGDRYETKVSDTKQNSGSTLAFDLTQTLVIAKDSEVRIAVIADLSSGATAAGSNDTYTVSLSAVTANGDDTGTTISVSPSGSGQAMTSETSGGLTVSVDSSSPVAKVVLDANQGGKQTLGIFRLAASNRENIELDSFKITDDGSDTAVETYYFQAMNKNGVTAIGSEVSVVGGATATAYFADGQVSVPANDYILMVVKGQMADVTTSASDNESTVQVTVAADNTDVVATGLASGATINGGGSTNYDAATHYVFQAYPTFAWQTVSTTTLTNNSNHLVAKLKITAVGDEDVKFLSGSTSEIKVQATIVGDDTDTASEVLTVKDEQGTTLDLSTDATTTADFTSASGTIEFVFDFSSAALTIPAGTSKTISFYADTSDLEDDNDSIQLWLDASTVSDLSWSINGTGDFDAQAGILWSGSYMSDAYAQLHVNPS